MVRSHEERGRPDQRDEIERRDASRKYQPCRNHERNEAHSVIGEAVEETGSRLPCISDLLCDLSGKPLLEISRSMPQCVGEQAHFDIREQAFAGGSPFVSRYDLWFRHVVSFELRRGFGL